jgi:hypothetical protein
MKKTLIITLVSLFAVVGAHAASTDGAVTTSTDPAKAAAVERHAQELQARSTKSAVKPVVHSVKKTGKHHKHHASGKKAAAKK